MADRDLWVRIKADAGSLMTGLAKAGTAVKNFDRDLAKNAQRRQGLEELGTAYRNVALAAGIGLAAVVKSAMDWETAWAGVSKTVNGSNAELAKLEGQLREMARTMPATHQEIAAVAEAAGQLGVATPNVAEFTRIMVQLGETTNLTADEAATSLAQLMNVMQTAPQDVDNLGASLVALGNNGASTERDILQMAQNIAGAGKTVGLSETDVLGLANALASVGIEAEAGGSAVSRILIDMSKAAKQGSPDLTKFAKASGMTAVEFKRLVETAPAKAFDVFTKGLGKINDEGGDVFTLLEGLGQSDVRVTRALLGMANSGDLLSDSLKLGASSFKENTALANEYGKRSETSAAKAQVAWNGIKDNLIDIGAEALPVVVELSEAVSDLTGFFSGLPAPIQGGVVKMLALTAALAGGLFVVTKSRLAFSGLGQSFEASGAAAEGAGRRMALMRGGAGIAGTALLGFADSLGEVDEAAKTTATVLGAAAIGFSMAGPWGLAVGAGIGILKVFGDANKNAEKRVAELSTMIDTQTGKIKANGRAFIISSLQKSGAFKDARKLGIGADQVTAAALGDAAAQRAIDKATSSNPNKAGATSGRGGSIVGANDEAANAARRLEAALGGSNKELQAARDKARDTALANEELARQEILASDAGKKLKASLGDVPNEVITRVLTPGAVKSQADVVALAREFDLTPDQITTVMKTAGIPTSKADIKSVMDAIAAADKAEANPRIRVDAGNSFSIIGGIQRSINRVTGTTVYVKVKQAGGTPGGILREANGGIVDYYANGGMSENHHAQIAPAGSWRVWAEPETGGEAYIPLAPSKRKRSLELWAETGRRLGVQGFAGGGISQSGTSIAAMDYKLLAREIAKAQDGRTLEILQDNRRLKAIVRSG